MTAAASGYESLKADPTKHQQWLSQLLADAGITINGSKPWDPQIHHPHTYQRILAGGSVAIGESYMDGWWDCERLDELIDHQCGGGHNTGGQVATAQALVTGTAGQPADAETSLCGRRTTL